MGILGICIAFFSIIAAQLWHGGSLLVLVDGPAFFIVFGGTLGAVAIQTPFSVFTASLKQLIWIFIPPRFQTNQQVEKIDLWGKSSRRLGFLSLEEFYDHEEDPFTKHGLELIIDGADSQQLRAVLETEMVLDQEHHEICAKFYESMGGYSPTIGILGAVLGLIEAMSHINDPERLGAGISVAFVATIYGVGFANLLYIPIANRLRMIHYQYSLFQQMTIEGLVAVANGEGQLELSRRLSVFRVNVTGLKDAQEKPTE